MKKKLSILGIVIGVLFVLVGILSIFGALGDDASYPSSAPYDYDSGYAEFGGDYYTYSSNNAAEAASAARTAARNVKVISEFLTLFCGLTSILFGLMVICGFGIVLSAPAQIAVNTNSDYSANVSAPVEAPVEILAETPAENI